MAPRRGRENVYVNIYDLSPYNENLIMLGGIEVHGTEYAFGGGGGIFSHTPKQAPGVALRSSILLGEIDITSREVEALVERMRPNWPGQKYNTIKCNCNSFADELGIQLVGARIPGWVNRLSAIGNYFACLIPDSIGSTAPVDADGRHGQEGDGSGNSGFHVVPARRGVLTVPPSRRQALAASMVSMASSVSSAGSSGTSSSGSAAGAGAGERNTGWSSFTGESSSAAPAPTDDAASAAALAASRRADREKMVAAAMKRQANAAAAATSAASAATTNTSTVTSSTVSGGR